MSINIEAGRYTIHVLNDAAGTISARPLNMTYKIPQQRLRLRGYRVHIDTAANALASGVLYIDLTDSSGSTILSYNHMIDNNPNTILFGLPLDNAIITNRDSLDKVLFMSKPGDINLKLTVYKITTATQVVSLEANLMSIYLDFETETGAIAF